jgi:hypothetical protein
MSRVPILETVIFDSLSFNRLVISMLMEYDLTVKVL